MKAHQITRTSLRERIMHLLLFLLIIFDLRTYLVKGSGISLITSFLIFSYLICYLYLCLSKSKVYIRLYDINVFLFLSIYGIRMYTNIFIDEIYNTIFQNNITYLIYFFMLSILPYLAGRKISFSDIRINKFLFILFVFYILALTYSFSNVLESIAMKTYIGNDGRFEANAMLDTIGYGHLGLTLFLISISLYIQGYKKRFFWVLGMVCGILSIILANSRSPMLALLACLVFLFSNRISIKLLIVLFITLFLFFTYIDEINIFFQNVFKSQFVDRFLTIFQGDNNGMSGRNIYYDQGWQIFSENPLLGKSFLLTSGNIKGDYVHNFFLESLMTGGILGGIFYLIMTIWGLICSYKIIINRDQYTFFALFFIQMFIYSMFSRSFIALPLYWLSLSSVYSIYQNEYEKS